MTGTVACVRCGRFIDPAAAWDLDHGDAKVDGVYLGPAHAFCNRSAGGKTNAGKRMQWSRRW